MRKIAQSVSLLETLYDQHQIVFDDDIWIFKDRNNGAKLEEDITIDFRSHKNKVNSYLHADCDYDRCLKLIAMYQIMGVGHSFPKKPITVKVSTTVLSRYFQHCCENNMFHQRLMTPLNVEFIFDKYFSSDQNNRMNSKRHLYLVMRTIKNLFLYKDMIPDYLVANPFPHKKIKHSGKSFPIEGYWSAPPEPVSLYLVNRALQLVECLGDQIINAAERYIDALIFSHKSKYGYVRITATVDNAIKDLELISPHAIADLTENLSLSKPSDICTLFKRLQDACFILLTYTCGPRVSEVRRAHSGSLVYRQHENGITYPYFTVARSKKGYSSIAASGGKPSGADQPWILSSGGELALKTLIRLSEKYRQKSGIDNLWLRHGSGITIWPVKKESTNFGAMTSLTFSIRLNAFSKFIRLFQATGWDKRLHTHQGRKSFAGFVAKRDRSMLGALAEQYSHSSAISVDFSYARPDSEFRRMVTEELYRDVGLAVSMLMSSNSEEIFHNKGAGGKEFVGLIKAAKDVSYLLAKGTPLIPCQWGVCAYNQSSSACDGSRSMPDTTRRTPEICAGCKNFFASAHHRQWWVEFRSDGIKYLDQKNLPRQSRLILEKRVDIADSIICKVTK